MTLSRRDTLRKLLAMPAVAAAAVVVSKSASAQTQHSVTAGSSVPPDWTPPPPDTRTPREVWQDSENQYNDWLEGIINNNSRYQSYQRQIHHVTGKTYLRLKDRLKARGMTVEEMVMGGDTFLIIHGNLYTIGQWW